MTITIPQKMSNSGSIYDLASDQFDRQIEFGEDYQYAVVMPSYYNAKITRHKSADLAIKKAESLTREGYNSVTIIDRDGNMYDVDYGQMHPMGSING